MQLRLNRLEHTINYLIIRKISIVCKLSSDHIVKIVHCWLIDLRLLFEDLGSVKCFQLEKKLIEHFFPLFCESWLLWHLIRTVNAILCSCFENFPFRNCCHLRIKCLYLSTSLTLHLLSTIIWEHFLFSSRCLLISFSLFNSFIINTILW